MASEEFDRLYNLLTQSRWRGVFTDRLQWRREGDKAVVGFGDGLDATQFVHGYLDDMFGDPSAIKRVDMEESVRQRQSGRREDLIDKKSLVDQVEFSEAPRSGMPVTVGIPLEILEEQGLRELLAQEKRMPRQDVDDNKMELLL